MKKTICDKCGKEDIGRNSSFEDRLIKLSDGSYTYIDLCDDCDKAFDEFIDELDKERAEKIKEYVNNNILKKEN